MTLPSPDQPTPKPKKYSRRAVLKGAAVVGGAAAVGAVTGLGLGAMGVRLPDSSKAAEAAEIKDPAQERINAIKQVYLRNYTPAEKQTAENHIKAWANYFKGQTGEEKLERKMWTEIRPKVEQAAQAVQGLTKDKFNPTTVHLDVLMGLIRAESSGQENVKGIEGKDIGYGSLNKAAVEDLMEIFNWQGEPDLQDGLTNIIFTLGYLMLLEEIIGEKGSALSAYHVGPGKVLEYKNDLMKQNISFNPTHFEDPGQERCRARDYFYDVLGATVAILETNLQTKA